MAQKTYDPKGIVAVFAGVTISGYADGTFVVVERAGDAFTKQVGADGEVCRTRNRDRSGSVTITLLQSSVSNDLLEALAASDELSNTGSGPFFLRDLNGTTLIAAQNAWIRKRPNVEFAKEAGPREWVLDCDVLDMTVGGAL